MRNDNVNHPAHYTSDPSGVECIEITRHRDFNIGNAIKYLWRAGRKEDPTMGKAEKTVEDLRKAIFYIKDEIKLLGGSVEDPKPASQETSVADAPDSVYLIYKDGTAAAYDPANKPSAAIKLEAGQWIPSLGELKFIQLFRKEVNEALEHAGGDALDPVWYWSSTEYSAAYAWSLNLYDGIANYYAKATPQGRVRPVSAFLL